MSSMNSAQTVAVNMQKTTDYVPVDRQTQFGNPFRLKKDGGDYTLAESLEAYRDYFRRKMQSDPIFRGAVEQLSGERLGCHCKPDDCHADVIVEYLTGEWQIDDLAALPGDINLATLRNSSPDDSLSDL